MSDRPIHRAFRIPRWCRRPVLLAPLLVAVLVWVCWSHPLLLEQPGWILGRPADATILQALPSARRIDYRPLKQLLHSQRWQEADRETQALLARILALRPLSPDAQSERSVVSSRGLRRAAIVDRIPCTDLLTLDRLWSTASEGRFGFRRQRQITEEQLRREPSLHSVRDSCTRACLQSHGSSLDLKARRCVADCMRSRTLAGLDRIARAMGRQPVRTAGPVPVPAGFYPAPIAVVVDLEDNIHRHLARRTRQCGI